MTTTTEHEQDVSTDSMIEEYKARLSKLRELDQQQENLRERLASLDKQIKNIDSTLASLEEERQNLAHEEAEGKDMGRRWSNLAVKISSTRAKGGHNLEVREALEGNLRKMEEERRAIHEGLDPYQRGAWAEVTQALLNERPPGVDEWFNKLLVSLDEHRQLNFFGKVNLIFQKELNRDEHAAIRHSLAERFGLLDP